MEKTKIQQIVFAVWLSLSSEVSLAEDEALSVRGSFSLLGIADRKGIADFALNPENTYLKLPQEVHDLSVRPNLKLSSGPLVFVYRPRILIHQARSLVSDTWQKVANSVTSETNEAFGQWQISEHLSFTYGQQSFQWGATESASPSNRVFRETIQNRDFRSEVQGKSLARLTVIPTENISLVALVDYEATKQEEATLKAQDEVFHPSGLLKPEINWNNGSDYFGLVLGSRVDQKPWQGAYFNLGIALIDGLALYGDLSQEKGSSSLYPQRFSNVKVTPELPVSTSLITMQAVYGNDEKVFRSQVIGAKYDFVDGAIARLEYLHYDAAYDSDDRALLREAFESQDPGQRTINAKNLSALVNSSPEIPGQDLVYASLYWPEPFSIKKFNTNFRVMRSLKDQSQSTFAQFSYDVGDGGTLYLASQLSQSGNFDEMHSLVKSTYSFALRQDW